MIRSESSDVLLMMTGLARRRPSARSAATRRRVATHRCPEMVLILSFEDLDNSFP